MAAFLSTANWTLCQLGEQNHMQNNNTNEGMSVVNVPINTTAPTNRSREQPQQSTEYPEHRQRGMHSFNAGTPNPFEPLGTTRTPQLNHTRWSSRSPAQVAGMNTSMMQDQMENRYTISTPALLQGIRCFIDASTSPDQPSLMLRQLKQLKHMQYAFETVETFETYTRKYSHCNICHTRSTFATSR
jgi:hypothetical protein